MNMAEALYKALRKVMVLNKKHGLKQKSNNSERQHKSTIQIQVTLKKAFAPVSFLSSHLIQDLMSKHLEHLKAKIWYTEIYSNLEYGKPVLSLAQ